MIATDAQVRKLMEELKKHGKSGLAAARAGLDLAGVEPLTMARRLTAAGVVLLISCYETAPRLDDALIPGVVGPPSEMIRRSGSPDLYDFATAHWRFYDDYLDLQPTACADDSDGGVADWPYLWRHGAESFESSFANGNAYGWRAGLDVSSFGIVVLQTDERLWTFAADGGRPLHADRGGENMAAFATDTLLWASSNGAPALYDMGQPREPFERWKVVYSWRQEHGQAGSFDYWYQPSPAVQRDGTLIWTSGAGVTRALRPTGEVKWEAPAEEGTFLVTADDVVIRSKLGDFVAFEEDGGIRWHAPLPPEATRIVPSPLVDEGRYPSIVLPMWYETGRGGLLMTRRARDGAPLATHDTQDAGNLGGLYLIGVDLDGWYYISTRLVSGFSLSARTSGLKEMWRVPSQELEFAPIASASGNRLVTIDRWCRVNLLDRATGATLASHRMVGRAGRFLPRLFNGVLFVVAEISPPETVKPSQMHGRLRPDGGVIDVVADYGCFAAPWLDTDLCPSVYEDNRRRVYALYAFQVE